MRILPSSRICRAQVTAKARGQAADAVEPVLKAFVEDHSWRL